jgi:Zn2+/Cd2+-exporting ATPase
MERKYVNPQNITFAPLVIIFLIFASLTWWASMGTAVGFHEGSTLLVIANALRLLGYP